MYQPIASQFLEQRSDELFGSRTVLNTMALRNHSREIMAASAKVKAEDKLNQFNRLLSDFGGVAELKNIEGDFEVLNILRDSPALDFCEVRPLPLGEIPIFRTRILNPIQCTVGSLAGGGGTTYWATTDSGVQAAPFTYSTEKVMIPNLNNLYDMERLMQRRDGLARLDHADEVMYTNVCLNTLFGDSFPNNVLADPAVTLQNYVSGGGTFAGHTVYYLDPGVPAAAVPTVNYYNLHTEGGLTKKVFQTVNTHSIQIGRNFNKMYIPQQAVSGHSPVWESFQNLATPVALVTGTVGSDDPAKAIPSEMWSEFQKEDFRGQVVVDWFGQRIAVSKQNWLPAGVVLLFGDYPCVIVWDRLNLQTGNQDDGVLEVPYTSYYNYRSKTRNIATLRPDPALRNFLVVTCDS